MSCSRFYIGMCFLLDYRQHELFNMGHYLYWYQVIFDIGFDKVFIKNGFQLFVFALETAFHCARGMVLFCFDDQLKRFVNSFLSGLVCVVIGLHPYNTSTLFPGLGKPRRLTRSLLLAPKAEKTGKYSHRLHSVGFYIKHREEKWLCLFAGFSFPRCAV